MRCQPGVCLLPELRSHATVMLCDEWQPRPSSQSRQAADGWRPRARQPGAAGTASIPLLLQRGKEEYPGPGLAKHTGGDPLRRRQITTAPAYGNAATEGRFVGLPLCEATPNATCSFG